MDKSIKAKRDALIEDEAQWCQCKGNICHNCEPIIRHNFAIGFDAGYALAMGEDKVLVECLERIARLTAHTENPTKEMADYLTKQAGMKSRELAIEALKEFKARSE